MPRWPHRGLVYFVASERTGLVKIGFSTNLALRLRALAWGERGPVRLLAWGYGDREVERSFHDVLHFSRARGEWFRPTPEVLSAAAIVRKGADEASRYLENAVVSCPCCALLGRCSKHPARSLWEVAQ